MNKIRRKDFVPHLLKHPVDKIEGEGRGWRLAAVELSGRQHRRRPVVRGFRWSFAGRQGEGEAKERENKGK